jgi:multiple sugar transport system substrate-binding protein
LKVWIWDSNQQAGLQKICDEFAAKTGISAKIDVVNWDNYWTLLEAGGSGGEMADVFWMHSNVSNQYMSNGILLDLTDKIKNSKSVDISKYYQDVVDLYTMDGKNYAVPKDYDTIGLWYNKTLFDAAGVKYPDATWTWDDMYDAAVKLTDKTKGVYGYACNTTNNQDSWYNMVYSMGGSVLHEDGKASGMGDDATLKAMDYVGKLAKDVMPDQATMSETGISTMFENGQVAMITQGSWMVPEFKNNEYTDKNCDVAVLPKDKTTGGWVSIYNGLGWAAFSGTQHPDEAWQLIEYLGSEAAQKEQADLGVTMSAWQGTSDGWTSAAKEFNLQAYLDMAQKAKLVIRPHTYKTTTWENMLTADLVAGWTDPTQMETVCKACAEKMNQAIKDDTP